MTTTPTPTPTPEPAVPDYKTVKIRSIEGCHIQHDQDGCWRIRGLNAEELQLVESVDVAALRRELDDLRLMLRAIPLGGSLERTGAGLYEDGLPRAEWWLDDNYSHVLQVRMDDDGTGLPVLTDEARATLEGAK